LQSQAEMQQTANELGAAWKRIQYDATVSIAAKRQAFEQYAKAVMDANGGVVTSTLEVEASMLGVAVTAKNAGDAGATAMQNIAAEAKAANEQVTALNTSLKERNDAVQSSFAQDAAERTGGGTVAAGNTLLSIINTLKQYGLSDKESQSIAREFVDSSGDVPYFNNPGQLKYNASTLSEALNKAAAQALYGKDGRGAAAETSASKNTSTPGGTSSANASTGAAATTKTVINLTINSGGTTTTSSHEVETTTGGAAALQDVLTRIAAASRVVSRT
jgi:hypothetical protein